MTPDDPIKVYDARWQVGEFDDTEVRQLLAATYVYGHELNVDTVVLSRDARQGAPAVLEIAIEEAVRVGLRVYVLAEPVSTPHNYFAVMQLTPEHPNTMGVAITASHNPREYIGMKMTVPPARAIGLDCGPRGGMTRVRQLYHEGAKLPHRGDGTLELIDLTDEYIDFCLQLAHVQPGDLKNLSVVIDTFHGSAGPACYRALSRAGATIEPIRLIPNGEFPTGSPNPTSRGKLAHTQRVAKHLDYDVMIGMDGDGDRAVFGDGRGILSAGFAMLPILKTWMETNDWDRPAPVLYDPKVNPLALAEWSQLGAAPLLFRNGHSQIKDYMLDKNAIAAAEESGHYYLRLSVGDLKVASELTLANILMFLKALADDRGLMRRLWELEGKVFTTGEFNHQFESDETRDKAMDAAIAHLVAKGATPVTATPEGIDLGGTVISAGVLGNGKGVTLEPGWYCGYLRASTNEKCVGRSYFSADDPVVGQKIESEIRDILERECGGRTVE